MDWLNTIPATGITAVTLVVAIFVGLSRGWFYTKNQVDDMRQQYEGRVADVREDAETRVTEVRADRDARLSEKDAELSRSRAEAEGWRAAWLEAETGRRLSAEQTQRLLEGMQVTEKVVRAIPEVLGGNSGG